MNFNFKDMTLEEQVELGRLMLEPLSTPLELKNWIMMFLGLDMPVGHIDPDSTSSPIEAMWEIYDTVKNNRGDVQNSFIMLSCRAGYKTLSASILETILMLHFQVTIAHMAAIKEQSYQSVQYINLFFTKIDSLLAAIGWENKTSNKNQIEYRTDKGDIVYIKIIVCTPAGANSAHTNLFFVDEIDVIGNPLAYEESKRIPTYAKGRHPITIKLSTRKYAFGMMAREVERASETGAKLLRWNLMDIGEKCLPERHQPELPREDRYVAKYLPLKQLSVEEYNNLPDIEKQKYDLVKNAYHGCKSCPLLPTCKTNLANVRTDKDQGGLYRPIVAIVNEFKTTPPDMAEAQLMCFSPNTQILMKDGSCKNIEFVEIGDEVITHMGLSQKISNVFKRSYEGHVKKIEHCNWRKFNDCIVTPEHPYFINGIEFKEANEINKFEFYKNGRLKKKGDYLSLPINYQFNQKNSIKFDDFVKKPLKFQGNKVKIASSTGRYVPYKYDLTEEFGWIVGYFLAEGYFSRRSYSKNTKNLISMTFCSDEREIECHEKVRKFAKWSELTVSEIKSKNSHGYTIDIYNNSLSSLFLEICGEYSDKKRLHPMLMDANIDFLKGIFKGFDAGDGTKRKNCYRELTTTSYQLATQLFLIMMRLGLCPRIKKNKKLKNRKQSYRVICVDPNFISKQKRTKFLNKENYNLYRIDKIEDDYYKGFVYNLEVENDNSYIANGSAVHNCWRPSSKGLVYPRFETTINKGNVISLDKAWETIIGEQRIGVNQLQLIQKMKDLGIPFYAGVDWGYVHPFVIVIFARLPNGEVWIVDCYYQSGLEFSDILEIAKTYRDRYAPEKWYCDTAMPSHMKSFNKNGMKSPDFKKDIMGGIEALRSKIVDGYGRRQLKVLNIESNDKIVLAFIKHHFQLDQQGNPTLVPDDTPGIADGADAMRYVAQNLFPVRGTQKINIAYLDNNGAPLDPNSPEFAARELEERKEAEKKSIHSSQMKEEIVNRTQGIEFKGGSGKKGGFFWNM